MPKLEVVRKTHSQYVDVPAGQDPWAVAASHMTNEEVVSVAVHVLPVAFAPPRRTVGGKTAWKPDAPDRPREPSMGGEKFFRPEQ